MKVPLLEIKKIMAFFFFFNALRFVIIGVTEC